jgi:pimeloyl-ACP methyl ester carboxylesterase
MRAEVGRLEPVVLGSGEIAEAHPVRFWARPDPQAVLVCADCEGLDAWASVVAGAEERVALVGIANGGITHRLGEEYVYDRHSDRRARAYLYDVDPPYFARHMRYVTETVLPWAEATLGPLPKFVFGVSNGAAWAAQAAARHPERFAGALIFSMGAEPRRIPGSGLPPHALVAGQLEPGFHRVTAQYALRLRDRGVPVRLRRPVRGHDHDMWTDELVPALRWILHKTVSSESGDSQ